MSLKIYNTLTGEKEVFKPLHRRKVAMYVCGPTVYHTIHVGNARPYVFFDVVCRYLNHKRYQVTYVRNITDIDDKIIQRANEEKKTSAEIASLYTKAFEQDMARLKLTPPASSPKATEHIDAMIQWIRALIEKGYAYEAQGEVLFSIHQFKDYGKLSKRNTDDLIAGARVEVAKHKKNPIDFVLWKPSKANEPSWESPWGKGRPGWHLECSVMSTHYLGKSFDIHGGGVDLIFPHHENEIAQSEAYHQKPFVRYWMHNGMLVFGKAKMSKSLGNIIAARDFLEKYPAEVLKFILLSNHYRSSLDFSEQTILKSIASLERIYTTLSQVSERLKKKGGGTEPVEKEFHETVSRFFQKIEGAMDDDFNTAEAFGVIFDTVRVANRYLADHPKLSQKGHKILEAFVNDFKKLSVILGLFEQEPSAFLKGLRKCLLRDLDISADEIESLIRQRNQARLEKNWGRADEIRLQLLKKKIILEDNSGGTVWKVET